MLQTFWLCGKTTNEEELIRILMSSDQTERENLEVADIENSDDITDNDDIQKSLNFTGALTAQHNNEPTIQVTASSPEDQQNLDTTGIMQNLCPYVPILLNDMSQCPSRACQDFCGEKRNSDDSGMVTKDGIKMTPEYGEVVKNTTQFLQQREASVKPSGETITSAACTII